MANKKSKPELKIIQWNCSQLNSKLLLIKQFLIDSKPDIIMLNEIKCDKSESNGLYNYFSNYKCLTKCRNSFGGGVAIIIKNDIEFLELDQFRKRQEEILAIKIKIENKNTIVATWYNPPNQKLNELVLNEINSLNMQLILGGDFNAKTFEFGCRSNDNYGCVKFLQKLLMNQIS